MKKMKTNKAAIKAVKRTLNDIITGGVILNAVTLDGRGILLTAEEPFIDSDGNRYDSYRLALTAHSCTCDDCDIITLLAVVMCDCTAETVLDTIQVTIPSEFTADIGTVNTEWGDLA